MTRAAFVLLFVPTRHGYTCIDILHVSLLLLLCVHSQVTSIGADSYCKLFKKISRLILNYEKTLADVLRDIKTDWGKVLEHLLGLLCCLTPLYLRQNVANRPRSTNVERAQVFA